MYLTPFKPHKNQMDQKSDTTNYPPEFGWSNYAERVNGRFAMVGFMAVLIIEALSGETFLHWAGLG
jgi:hypothetical protein